MYFNGEAIGSHREEIANIRGVRCEDDTGHYLGSPTVWGRSRNEAMHFIKEKVQFRIDGWRNNLLNNEGKEVMIKSLITSIPTYAMSVFKLLIT